MPQLKATVAMVSRPLPAPTFVSPALVKVQGLPWPGFSRSRSRISCTEDGGAFTKMLEVSEHAETEPMYDIDTNSAAANEEEDEEEESSVWSQDEIDAISALFDRPMRQKPLKPPNPAKQRALPLPQPHKTRLPMAPSPKQHVRLAARAALSSRASVTDRVRKNPEALLAIAREIAALPPERDVAAVLDRWARFLRKGSLSLTIRELGHMGLPDRALQTLCWAQRQTLVPLFPDDRVLASTIEVLARFDQLKVESALDQCVPSASRAVLEAMASGFIRAGKVNLTRKLLELARINERTLGTSIYVKLMSEAARTPDGYGLAAALVDELGERPDLDLRPQDCTAVMKVCVKLRRYRAVESLFAWFRESGGGAPTVVMYTTVVHSRCRDGRHRDALALVWEMEQAKCLLDLPAYRVIVKLCVALGDQERALRYLARLKEAGFVPTADMYDNVIQGYAAAGRMAKCRQLVREAETTGLKLDRRLLSRLSEIEAKDEEKQFTEIQTEGEGRDCIPLPISLAGGGRNAAPPPPSAPPPPPPPPRRPHHPPPPPLPVPHAPALAPAAAAPLRRRALGRVRRPLGPHASARAAAALLPVLPLPPQRLELSPQRPAPARGALLGAQPLRRRRRPEDRRRGVPRRGQGASGRVRWGLAVREPRRRAALRAPVGRRRRAQVEAAGRLARRLLPQGGRRRRLPPRRAARQVHPVENFKELQMDGVKGSYRVDVDIPANEWINITKFYDVLIFNTGHWWGPDKFPKETPLVFYKGGKPIEPPLGIHDGLKSVLKSMASYIEREVPRKTLKLWRTQSPRHFYGGDWNQNGSCVSDRLLENHELDSWFDPRFGGVNKEARLVNSAIQEALAGTDIQLLNLTYMSEFRADAHPATWLGKKDAVAVWGQDCMHWCLPGVPDTWVDILAAHILHYFNQGKS